MYNFIFGILDKTGLGSGYTAPAAYAVYIISGVLFCVFARFLVSVILTNIFAGINKRKRLLWVEAALENKLFKKTADIVVPVIIYTLSHGVPSRHILWDNAVEISLITVALLLFNSMIKVINKVYAHREQSKNFPITSILQASQIAFIIIGGIIAVSALVGKNPTVLLGSIGAVTAVTSIVFKDAILGFAAGIQLTANNMIRIGDWIELPKRSANGTVVELSMMSVKIENFDKTATSIPAYTLISEEFINYRGLRDAGARRIKRSVHIDAVGVCMCDEAMLGKFKKIRLVKTHIENKLDEIEKFNSKLDCDMSEKTNGRRLTNIGVFRAYITAYLKQHPGIRQDLPLMVRQLELSGKGIPLEIYAFADVSVWSEYENIQSDIFDHLYAVIPEFGLAVYQSPSSGDIRRIAAYKSSE
ncbi:MAG: mechanosensitive ion channel family protein [Oscillospiraceae bacterium]|nr:mechanosensitive ion channel family protein [Oscillospiraceae bacterium]